MGVRVLVETRKGFVDVSADVAALKGLEVGNV